MYDVLEVSRHVINYSNIKDYGVSNLKLQKLLYFVQAYFLIVTSKPCFVEEIEAWDFGPAVPEAYEEYKQYGSTNIPYIESYLKIDEQNLWNSTSAQFYDNVISDNDKELINLVVDKFADYSATDLVALTQNQAPWKYAYENSEIPVISLGMIKDYFDFFR